MLSNADETEAGDAQPDERGSRRISCSSSAVSEVFRFLSCRCIVIMPVTLIRHDLGIEYTDNGSAILGTPSNLRQRLIEGVEQYYPRISPGARFPHFWVSEQSSGREGQGNDTLSPISSIDVVSRLSGIDSRWVLVYCNGIRVANTVLRLK